MLAFVRDTWSPKATGRDNEGGDQGADSDADEDEDDVIPRWAVLDVRF